MVEPGDLIFFDGRCEHWVKQIEANGPDQMGRLAVFAIPTYFEKSALSGMLIRSWQSKSIK